MNDPALQRGRATLAAVAKRAGVSKTTASFVLTGRDDMRVSAATRDRVLQAARVLSYTPRPPRLRAGRLPVIAFVCDTIASDHYAGEMVMGAVKAAAAHDHAVVTVESEGSATNQAATIAELSQRGVDRFIIAALATRGLQAPALPPNSRGVLLNCSDPSSDWPTILPDDRAAAATAVDHLVAAGHGPRIWLVGEALPTGPFAGSFRRVGVLAALSAHGFSLAGHVESHWWPPDTREAFASALAETGRSQWPTAVIAMNDRAAMGVYQAAQVAGLSIPGELSVIAFDNSELAWWLYPGLTSVELPYLQMGRLAVESLVEAPGGQGVMFVPMRLHERDSVGPPG